MAFEDRLHAERANLAHHLQDLSFAHYRAHYKSVEQHTTVASMLVQSQTALEELEHASQHLDASFPWAQSGSRSSIRPSSVADSLPAEEALAILELPALVEHAVKSGQGATLDDAYDLLHLVIPTAGRMSLLQDNSDHLAAAVTGAVNAVLQSAAQEGLQRSSLSRLHAFVDKVAGVAAENCKITIASLAGSAAIESAPQLQVCARSAATRSRLQRICRSAVGVADPGPQDSHRVSLSDSLTASRFNGPDLASAMLVKNTSQTSTWSMPEQGNVIDSLTVIHQSGYNARRLAREGCTDVAANSDGGASAAIMSSAFGSEAVDSISGTFNRVRHVTQADTQTWLAEYFILLEELDEGHCESMRKVASDIVNISL